MSDNTVICWNCLRRTQKGQCEHCGEQLGSADPKDQTDPSDINYKFIVQLRNRENVTKEFQFDRLKNLVEEYFHVHQSQAYPQPMFVVGHKGEDISDSFEKLHIESQNVLPGLIPFLERMDKYLSLRQSIQLPSKSVMVIRYGYQPDRKPINKSILRMFFLATIISVLFSGLVNVSRWKLASQGSTEISPFAMDTSSETLLLTIGFTIVLMAILAIREWIQRTLSRRYGVQDAASVFLPAIPIFELGTIGSFLVERDPHISRSGMFNTAFWGPFLMWLLSFVLFLASLPLSVIDSTAAAAYAERSIVASGTYEPLFFTLLKYLGEVVGWLEPSELAFSQQILFHPISIAALATLYITGFHLLPITQLNGGIIIGLSLGKRFAILMSLTTIIILIFVELWWVAIVAFIFHRRIGRIEVLNEFSPLPKFWWMQLLLVLTAVVLSFPVPI